MCNYLNLEFFLQQNIYTFIPKEDIQMALTFILIVETEDNVTK